MKCLSAKIILCLCLIGMLIPACSVPNSSTEIPTSVALSPSPNTPSATVSSTVTPTKAPTTTITLLPLPSMPVPTGVPPILRPGWTSFTNANYVRAMLFDHNGNLWTAGSGGVVHWNVETGDYVKYTTEHGLANNYVLSIAQAADGALWFGTRREGVSRFNGKSWTTYTTKDGLLDNSVYSIANTPDGALWFGSYRGLTRYDGQTWTTFPFGSTGTKLKRADVLAVAPDGTLWVGGIDDSGLQSYDGKDWQDYSEYLPDRSVTAITVAPDGTLWVGTTGGLSRYQNGIWQTFDILSDQETGFIRISSLAVAPDGSLWVGFSLADVMDQPREVLEDYSDYFHGVLHYDGNTWEVFGTQEGLVSNEILAITVGPDGSIWFGSYNHGLSRYDGERWNTFQTSDEIPSNIIGNIEVSKTGVVWLSHTGGVSRYDGFEWITFDQINTMLSPHVCDIYIEKDGSVWFGTFDGVARLQNQEWTIYPEAENEWLGGVCTIAVDLKGNYLFGAMFDGVSQFDGQKWSHLSYLEDPEIRSILPLLDGTLWFGTSRHGIYTYDGKIVRHYTTSVGLISDRIAALVQAQDGTIWVGTNKGVSRFDGKDWFSYSEEDGLIGEVHKIVIDKQGVLWVGTSGGLYRFDGKEWVGFTSNDGLGDSYVNDVAMGPDGTVWVAAGGLSRYLPPDR